MSHDSVQALVTWLTLFHILAISHSCWHYRDYDSEVFAGIQIPIMVVGCKADQALNLREKSPTARSSIAEECGADEFNLVSYLPLKTRFTTSWCILCIISSWFVKFQDCHQVKHISPGSTNAVKLTKFFDKVHVTQYVWFHLIVQKVFSSSRICFLHF